MKIHISQDCIDTGNPHQIGACPIALAIWEQIPGASKVEVKGSTISFYFNKQRRNFALSQRARKFIKTFDYGKPVEPISIILPYFSKPHIGGPK